MIWVPPHYFVETPICHQPTFEKKVDFLPKKLSFWGDQPAVWVLFTDFIFFAIPGHTGHFSHFLFFSHGKFPLVFFLKKHKTPKRRRQVTGAKLRSSCGARKHSEVSTFMAEAEARPHVPPRIQRSVWGPPCTDNWCFGMFWLYNIIITGDKFPGNYRTYPTKREVWKIIFKSDFLMGYVSSLKGTIYNWWWKF